MDSPAVRPLRPAGKLLPLPLPAVAVAVPPEDIPGSGVSAGSGEQDEGQIGALLRQKRVMGDLGQVVRYMKMARQLLAFNADCAS
jgi:hypothetical protein